MKLEKFEIEENFKEKLNQLKISMEKNKINQNTNNSTNAMDEV